MKISYRTHPALKILSKKEITFFFDEKDAQFHTFLKSYFPPTFNKFYLSADYSKIFHVSKSFMDAAKLSVDSLLLDDILFDLVGESGIFLMGELTIFYNIKCLSGQKAIVEYVGVSNNTVQDSVIVCCFALQSGNGANKYNYFYSGVMPVWTINNPGYHFGLLVMLIALFKKYAPIETRYVEGGAKHISISGKIINESLNGITFLDSKWFTNIIKSGPFNVRAHVRW